MSEERPNFNIFLDPKCDWAVRHLEYFPVEVGWASYRTLLRVPGIGVKSAQRILRARKIGKLDFPALKKMGVVLKERPVFYHMQWKDDASRPHGRKLYHKSADLYRAKKELGNFQHVLLPAAVPF